MYNTEFSRAVEECCLGWNPLRADSSFALPPFLMGLHYKVLHNVMSSTFRTHEILFHVKILSRRE